MTRTARWGALFVALALSPGMTAAQEEGLVYQHPGADDVVVRGGLDYSGAGESPRDLDLYYPGPEPDSSLPAVVFVIAFPDSEERGSLKDYFQYPAWARLVAAEGMVGVLYEAPEPMSDLRSVLEFLRSRGPDLGIDPERVALWSCSGNVPLALRQLREPTAPVELRAVVAYYGIMPTADRFQVQAFDSIAAEYDFPLPWPDRDEEYRTDVPLLVVRAGRDEWENIPLSIDRFTAMALERNLPVTLINLPDAPHGFDVSHDTEESRRVMEGTLEFLKSRLGSGPELGIELVGNAGVLLSDDATSLLVDLPYRSGAYGYQEYEPESLSPRGNVVSVITHDHDDHFNPEIFLARDGWRVVGPPSVTEGLPPDRVVPGDSVEVGAFGVIALPTPHTPDHRSYRIRWEGRVLHFTGDTEDLSRILEPPEPDVLFITPWLACKAQDAGPLPRAARTVVYHLQPDGSDRICGRAEALSRGSTLTLTPGGSAAGGGR